MKTQQIISLVIILSFATFASTAQEGLTVEEAEAQLLLKDVQNDIDELDGTKAARIKDMNKKTKSKIDQIEKENETIENMKREAELLEQQMKDLESGGNPKDDPDESDS